MDTKFYLPANKKKYNYTLGSLVPGEVVYWEPGDAWKWDAGNWWEGLPPKDKEQGCPDGLMPSWECPKPCPNPCICEADSHSQLASRYPPRKDICPFGAAG